MSPRRLPPRPRSRPHRFRRDWSISVDPAGHVTCWCGSLDTHAVHRTDPDEPDRLDVARLVAGDKEPE